MSRAEALRGFAAFLAVIPSMVVMFRWLAQLAGLRSLPYNERASRAIELERRCVRDSSIALVLLPLAVLLLQFPRGPEWFCMGPLAAIAYAGPLFWVRQQATATTTRQLDRWFDEERSAASESVGSRG